MKRGEEILTISKKREVSKWSEFYTWGHREVDRVAEFVVITTQSGKVLKISEDHLLFGEGRVAKRAGKVKKGNYVTCIHVYVCICTFIKLNEL